MEETNLISKEIFSKFNEHLDAEQVVREKIREMEAVLELQVIHTNIDGARVSQACSAARKCFETSRLCYLKLAELVPKGQYYRFCDFWQFVTQRLIFLIGLVIYLEKNFLVSRETCAEILGLSSSQADGFHLDIENYLMGILQMVSELSRFATNSVTMGDYQRVTNIQKFVSDLNSGFRLLNLKNDSLRKRFDALKYDVKKIEEIVYDLSIRGLKNSAISTAE